MRCIYKFPFKIDDRVVLYIPGAPVRVVHIGPDARETPCVWAEVDTTSTKVKEFVFYVRGTGHELPANARHYKSFTSDGLFVWHIYLPEGETDA